MTTILDRIGNTPLVRLTAVAHGLPVPIYVKCEHLNPGGSVKDRIAMAICEKAENAGQLHPSMTLIEATAGNTGVGLALVASVRGYKLVCVMPEKMSVDKRRALRSLGAEVVITDNAPPSDPRNFQRVAERMAAENGWFLTDQFRNAANPDIHQTTTGPEIAAQVAEAVGGSIGAFVAGAGTGGTITGVGRHLKATSPDTKIILADPAGSGLAQWVKSGELGPDGAYAVEGIGSSQPPQVLDRSVIDDAVTVTDAESFAMARRLIREEGLLVGGSAGTAVAAAVKIASGDRVKGPVVALLPDGMDRYASCDWIMG